MTSSTPKEIAEAKHTKCTTLTNHISREGDYDSNTTPEPHSTDPEVLAQPRPIQHICGLRPRTFYIILAIVCALIIGGGIGGGLGGGLSKKNTAAAPATNSPTSSPTQPSNTDSTTLSPQTSGPSSTTTSSSTIPKTTFTLAGSDRTLVRDCPESNNTIYKGASDGTGELYYRKRCGVDFHRVQRPNNPTGM